MFEKDINYAEEKLRAVAKDVIEDSEKKITRMLKRFLIPVCILAAVISSLLLALVIVLIVKF